jgi:nucleotide-binding universal stress UspA family protein
MSDIILCVVDQSSELQSAIQYACRMAVKRGAEVGLLFVTEPGDFQHFMAVESLLREERRAAAEEVLRKWALVVEGLTGMRPVTYVREGAVLQEMLELIAEEKDISHLVLAAAGNHESPGPLISGLTGRWLNSLRVPLTIIPCVFQEGGL